MTPTGFPATLPAPRRPDPLDVPALGWGVLGTGWIAERFVHALRTSMTQQVVAVGSRSQASAERFAGSAEQGGLGDVRTVLADHGERFDPPHRILDPAMAGGSLLDLGSYSPRWRPGRSARPRTCTPPAR